MLPCTSATDCADRPSRATRPWRLTARNTKPQTQPEGVLSGFSATTEQFIAASQSAATKRAYASDLKHFFADGGSVPASPVVLAEYLARCAEKLSVATLERRLTTIHKAHLEKNLESPARSDTVKRVMQGIRRTLGTKQRQVQPLVKDDLLSALVMIEQQKVPIKAARDRALLLVGFASAMRRSELVAVRVEHLTYLSNGVEIFLPSSKTDQEAQGRTVFIPHANGERCPVRALAHWLEVSEINEGLRCPQHQRGFARLQIFEGSCAGDNVAGWQFGFLHSDLRHVHEV